MLHELYATSQTRHFLFQKERGEINVCKAVQDMIYEREKLAEIRTLVKQIQKGRLTIEQAAEDSNMTVEQFKEAMSKLPQEAV